MEEIPLNHIKILKTIGRIGHELGQPVYAVGGYVRDYYLQRHRKPEDQEIDLVTLGSGVKLAQAAAKALDGSNVSVFKNFGTAHFVVKNTRLEFIGARKESYSRDSRKPAVEEGSLTDDQLRRDFTINALYWNLAPGAFGLLLDPFEGIKHLSERLIKTPTDPKKTFDDDPLRMIRAIRFATQLHFNIEERTWEAIKSMADRISIVSMERIIDEINKIIMTDRPSIGFRLLFESGLLYEFFPEMARLQGVQEINNQRHKDNFFHTLQVLDNVVDSGGDLWLRWAAIMHDIAKPPTQRFQPGVGWTFHGHDALGAKWTKSIFRRLTLPLDERQRYVSKLVRLHLRPIALVDDEVSDSAVRRLIFDAGDDIDALMTLCRADITSKNHHRKKRYLQNFDRVEKRIKEVEEKDRLRNWQPPLDGKEIMDLCGLKPGKEVGLIKEAIKEAILNGEIPNEKNAAAQYMDELKTRILS